MARAVGAEGASRSKASHDLVSRKSDESDLPGCPHPRLATLPGCASIRVLAAPEQRALPSKLSRLCAPDSYQTKGRLVHCHAMQGVDHFFIGMRRGIDFA